MSWHYLPELVEGSSQPRTFSDGAPLPQSRLTRTDGRCCFGDSATVCWTCSRSGTTLEHSTDMNSKAVSMWLLREFPARSTQSPLGGERRRQTFGHTQSELWPSASPEPFSSRMCRGCDGLCLHGSPTCEDLATPSKGPPRLGPHPWVVRTFGTESGYLPTPTASSYGSNIGGARGRRGEKRKSISGHLGGPENPQFREWLMGWPIGWTGLGLLETGRFRQWLHSHGGH